MKEHYFMADPLKFFAALGTCVVSVFMVWKSFSLGVLIPGIFFLFITIVFLYVMVMYGSVLHISGKGVRRVFLGFTLESLSWDQIREVGVVGVNVFNGTGKKKKPGRRYIYFSPEALDDESRFKLALEWPPGRGTLYCVYTQLHAEAIQFLWQKPFASFNAGDIFVMIDE